MGLFGIGALNIVSLATLPVGGPMAMGALRVFSQMGQQLLQQFGEQNGIPQSKIDLQQSRFAAKVGDHRGAAQNFHQAIESFGRESRASLTDIADAQRKANDSVQELLNTISQDRKTRQAREGHGEAVGWLEAMAQVLGEKLDTLAHDMQDLAGKVNKEDPSTTTDFTVASQQFNMLMEASSNALKTIGESMGKMAARQ